MTRLLRRIRGGSRGFTISKPGSVPLLSVMTRVLSLAHSRFQMSGSLSIDALPTDNSDRGDIRTTGVDICGFVVGGCGGWAVGPPGKCGFMKWRITRGCGTRCEKLWPLLVRKQAASKQVSKQRGARSTHAMADEPAYAAGTPWSCIFVSTQTTWVRSPDGGFVSHLSTSLAIAVQALNIQGAEAIDCGEKTRRQKSSHAALEDSQIPGKGLAGPRGCTVSAPRSTRWWLAL